MLSLYAESYKIIEEIISVESESDNKDPSRKQVLNVKYSIPMS